MMYQISRFAQIINEDDITGVPKGSFESSQMQSALAIVFSVAGAVALLIIAISALRIVLSRGKSEDVSKARNAIIYAAVGLGISMVAFIMVEFVIGNI